MPTNTPNLNLTKPDSGETNWADLINGDLDIIDAAFGGLTLPWTSITGKPSFAAVATSGSYTDLTNKPTIPAAQVNSDWTAVSGVAQILNKPALATVATSGAYSDLTGKPALATVATTGTYTDLISKPTIPAAQVNSDWNSSSGLSQILNKPSLATVATSGSYTDLTSKPTIPTAVAFKVNGTATGSQTAVNFVAGTNITITDNGTGSLTFAASGSGGGRWGSITGTLSSQTDLNTALSGKQGTLTLTTTGSGAATLTGATLNVPTPTSGTIPTPAFIQAASLTFSGTHVLAFTSNNTAGNMLFACGSATGTCSDAQGNAWIAIPGTNGFYCPSCKGGANTVTITASGTNAMTIAEFAGVNTVDAIATGSGAGAGGTWTSSALTTNHAQSIIVGNIANGFDSLTVNAPFSVLGVNESYFLCFYEVVSTIQTSLTASGTQLSNSGNTWGDFVCNFYYASGAGTVTNVTSADGNATVTSNSTTPVITVNAAPKLATARTINGVSFDGTGNVTVTAAAGTLTGTALPVAVIVPASQVSGLATSATTDTTNATNITSGTLPTAQSGALTGDVTKSAGSASTTVTKVNGTSLAGLSTGILKNTTTTGVPSIAVAGTDYQAPITLTTTGTSGAATFTSNTLNIPQYAGTAQVYPGAGIAVSTGTAWTTSLTAPASAIVGISDTQTLTNKSIVATQLTGTISAAQLPAFTGDVTKTSGSVATTVTAINGTTLSGLATGILKNTTATGAPSIAIASDFPTLNQNTTGSAGSLASYPGAGIVISTGSAFGTSLTAPSSTIVGISDTQTFTNKRVTKRTGTTTSSATPSINTDNVDYYSITSLAAAITGITFSGTPTEGQTLWLAITDNGTARALTPGTSVENSTITFPSTTVISTRLDIGLVWNTVTSKWRCVAVA